MFTYKNTENKQTLTDKLFDFLKSIDLDEPIEVKPTEYLYSKKEEETDLEVIQKDNLTNLEKQLENVGSNIVVKFFELTDEKFKAVLDRISLWGYELCLNEFILNYYLVLKKDNRLRQFVLLHIDKLVNTVKNLIERQLLLKMNKFDFINNNENELKELTYKLAEKEKELLAINPTKLLDDTSEEIINTDIVSNLREEILQDLKEMNPELETDNWI